MLRATQQEQLPTKTTKICACRQSPRGFSLSDTARRSRNLPITRTISLSGSRLEDHCDYMIEVDGMPSDGAPFSFVATLAVVVFVCVHTLQAVVVFVCCCPLATSCLQCARCSFGPVLSFVTVVLSVGAFPLPVEHRSEKRN